jgi:hypothetical protein
MLKNVKKNSPKADFLISDFSSLHESIHQTENKLEINRPIISTKKEAAHEKNDFLTILDPDIGTADIFFQTDFDFLQYMTARLFNKTVNYFLN